MYNIDNGSQLVFFDYKEEALGQKFNRVNYRLASHGIYEGGAITRVDDTHISIAPFVSYIELAEATPYPAMGVRIQTRTAATITTDVNTKTLIVGEFEWDDSENNFMEFKAVSDAELPSLKNPIILGRIKFNGSILDNTASFVHYNEKSWAFNYYYDSLNHKPPFKVEAVFPGGADSTKVKVYPGVAIINGKKVSISTITNSPVFSNTTLGRKDIVYISDTGSIVIEEGVDSGSPTLRAFNNKYLPIAIITRGATATAVLGEHIEYLHPSLFMQGLISETTNTYFIIDSSSANTVRFLNDNGTLRIKNKDGSAFADFQAKHGYAENITLSGTLISNAIEVATIKHTSASVANITLSNTGITIGTGITLNTKDISVTGNIIASGNITGVNGTFTGASTFGSVGKTTVVSTSGTAPNDYALVTTEVVSTSYLRYGTNATNNIQLTATGVIIGTGITLSSPGLILGGGSLGSHKLVVTGTSSLIGQATTQSLIPSADSTYDIGSSSVRYANGYFDKCYGAVGNDFADVFNCNLKITDIEFGKVYVNNNGKIEISSKYAQKGILGIASDQYSYLAGDGLGVPISIGGFLKIENSFAIGTPLTSGKKGSLKKANLLVRLFFPERIVATVVDNHKIKVR